MSKLNMNGSGRGELREILGIQCVFQRIETLRIVMRWDSGAS